MSESDRESRVARIYRLVQWGPSKGFGRREIVTNAVKDAVMFLILYGVQFTVLAGIDLAFPGWRQQYADVWVIQNLNYIFDFGTLSGGIAYTICDVIRTIAHSVDETAPVVKKAARHFRRRGRRRQ